MQRNKLSSVRKSRLIYFTTLVTMAVVAIIFAGCRADNNQNKTEQNPTPSPSPKPSGSPQKLMLPGDTIIVVKDGSVRIEVNKDLCKLDTQNPEPGKFKYTCENLELDDVTIRSALDAEPPPRCPKAKKDSDVTIDGGGGGKDIKIKGHNDFVTIDFKEADYPLCVQGVPWEHCGNNKVGKVKVDTHEKECDPAEKCEIWVRKK